MIRLSIAETRIGMYLMSIEFYMAFKAQFFDYIHYMYLRLVPADSNPISISPYRLPRKNVTERVPGCDSILPELINCVDIDNI